MIVVLQILMCIVFVELFVILHLQQDASSILQASKEAMGVLSSSEITDDEKEVFARRASLRIFKVTGSFLGKFLLLFAALYAMYAGAVEFFSMPEESFIQTMLSLPVLLGLTIVAIAYTWIRHGRRRRL
jgi:hypothetical protein